MLKARPLRRVYNGLVVFFLRESEGTSWPELLGISWDGLVCWLWQSTDEAKAMLSGSPGPAHFTQWLKTAMNSQAAGLNALDFEQKRCKLKNKFTLKKFTHFQNRGGPKMRENGPTWMSPGLGVSQLQIRRESRQPWALSKLLEL